VVSRQPATSSAFIEAGSPWENGYNESFNGKLRDELLNGEVHGRAGGIRGDISLWRTIALTLKMVSRIKETAT